jgi:hypothetical protein
MGVPGDYALPGAVGDLSLQASTQSRDLSTSLVRSPPSLQSKDPFGASSKELSMRSSEKNDLSRSQNSLALALPEPLPPPFAVGARLPEGPPQSLSLTDLDASIAERARKRWDEEFGDKPDHLRPYRYDHLTTGDRARPAFNPWSSSKARIA